MEQYGPQTFIGEDTHKTKYRLPGETFVDSMNRVAAALSDDETHRRAFKEILLTQRFLPAGRIQAGAGAPKHVTMHNCFVSGEIKDSLVDGPGCIMDRVKEAAKTMRMGGGIGYDFSTLRPLHDRVNGLMANASGPVSFMEIFDATCHTIASAGNRRGAQMAVIRVDHPDIEIFVTAKHNEDKLRGFNMSVGVTHKFMEHLESGKPFPLHFGGKVYKHVDPKHLWELIMRSTWDWAEPGVLFIDTINDWNNLWYCENISATNPCAEQPLPPYGACLLGSLNLTKYVSGVHGVFEEQQLLADVPHIIRAMDNVNDLSKYPLERQELEAFRKRRMGIGVTGLANTLETLGFPYGSKGFLSVANYVLQLVNDACYNASVDLAKEKGPFPYFDSKYYLDSKFIKSLDALTRRRIEKHGIRNSHLTSLAPTGTISLAADNVSSSAEPVFSHKITRLIQTPDGPKHVDIEDYAHRVHGIKGRTAGELSVQEHLDVLLLASKHVDSSVSKTCNVNGDIPWEDFKDIYVQAYKGGSKTCSTFNINGKRSGILKETKNTEEDQVEACFIDPETGTKTCS